MLVSDLRTWIKLGTTDFFVSEGFDKSRRYAWWSGVMFWDVNSWGLPVWSVCWIIESAVELDSDLWDFEAPVSVWVLMIREQ